MTPLPDNDFVNYPESSLRERIKLAYDWIPENCQRLLDGGCAYGTGTRYYKTKAVKAWGVDPNADYVAVARRRYHDVTFHICGLEQTPFEAEYFDAIIMAEVIEHVIDEEKTLNEMCRILRPGGTLILTTPHRGLFSFMDPDNYTYHLRTKAPWLYRWLYRAKYGKAPPGQVKPGYEQLHRHYSLQDLIRLFNNSDFKGRFELETVFQSGLFMAVFTSNVYELFSLILGVQKAGRLVKPIHWLADREFFMRFGPLAYNIAIRVRKK